VMATKRLLNFVDRGNALGARLAIPEHDKTLSTNAAAGLCVSIGALAQNLHFYLKRGGETFHAIAESIANSDSWTFHDGCKEKSDRGMDLFPFRGSAGADCAGLCGAGGALRAYLAGGGPDGFSNSSRFSAFHCMAEWIRL
jgi:hypothetical protein